MTSLIKLDLFCHVSHSILFVCTATASHTYLPVARQRNLTLRIQGGEVRLRSSPQSKYQEQLMSNKFEVSWFLIPKILWCGTKRKLLHGIQTNFVLQSNEFFKRVRTTKIHPQESHSLAHVSLLGFFAGLNLILRLGPNRSFFKWCWWNAVEEWAFVWCVSPFE